MKKHFSLLIGASLVAFSFLFSGCIWPPLDEYNRDVEVSSPTRNQEISSPFTAVGQARGSWYFEASFSAFLLDESGQVLASAPAQAQSDWMTTDWVAFEADLSFSVDERTSGTLLLEKSNPSGLPEHAAEMRVPVMLLPGGDNGGDGLTEPTRTVQLFYYNPSLDEDETGQILCSEQGLVAVERDIPLSQTPIQDTIHLLLQGDLTAAEEAQGITTEFPLSGLQLTAANLDESGSLTLEFSDPQSSTGGGSCRVGVLWSQIEATARQFQEVQAVTFQPEEMFQP